jgi:outer membrane protein (TIGR04327 family)
MKYILILIYLVGNLIAQETKLPEKTNKFNLTIKRATLEYLPLEYIQNDPLYTFNRTNIKNNKQTITPIQFRYHFEPWNLYTEISYQKIEFNNLNYNRFYPSRGGVDLNTRVFIERTRSDSKWNFYTSKQWNDTNTTFYGAGFRNILIRDYKKSTDPLFLGDEFKINANGIQLYAKHEVRLSSFLTFAIGLEPFYTQGKVNRQAYSINTLGYTFASYFTFYQNFINAQVLNLYGYDFDLNFRFRIYENLDFLVGYTRSRTYFLQNRLNYFSNNQSDYRSAFDPITKQPEQISGLYFGITAKF